MGPFARALPVTTPRPEDSAIRVIDYYTETFGLEITASCDGWRVVGGAEDPGFLKGYTDLVSYLAKTYGWPR
jgi:hypothetical protein